MEYEMSQGLNKVLIIGRLGRDPEMRYTPSGRPVTTFSIGASRSWTTSDGEQHTDTAWFNVVAWSNLAEICKQNLTKNQLVYIEGRLQTRHWEDQDGTRHTATEIVANEMITLEDGIKNPSNVSKDDNDDEEFSFL
jgi:single-strand DNA-binding protein